MVNATLEIAKREFLEHVLSWRFLIALVLSTLILVTSLLALASAYREDHDAYMTQQDTLAQDEDSFATVQREIHRYLARPNVLSIFVGGAGDSYRGDIDVARDGPFDAQRLEPKGGSGSPTNTRFDPLDLGFVAVVVMTFMAVIFSFDAVSGEKERGTLKLLLANPVPKDAVLLGKYLGGVASILVPFALSIVIGLAMLSFTGITLGAGAWMRLGVIAGFAVLMLSAFYLLGLVVSSMTRRSSTSLLVLTLVWLVLVFGVGNVAAVAAKASTDTITNADLQEQMNAIDDELAAQVEPIQEELFGYFEKMQRGNLTAAERERMDELRGQVDALAGEASDKRDALRSTALRQLDTQLRRAEGIAALSPAEAFRSVSTSLARSDYWSYRDVAQAAEEYQLEVERARQEWEGDNPTQGRIVMIGPGGRRVQGDDFEPPTFEYAPPELGEQLSSSSAMRDVLVLLGYNLVAFVVAYTRFLRYDVR